MTIRTLRHIHDLLIEDEAKTALCLKWAREAKNAAEDGGNNQEVAKAQEHYDAAYKKHHEAYLALEDFQTHEF